MIEYEAWNRIHRRRLAGKYGEDLEDLISRIGLLELTPAVLKRALEPFPQPVRTLDALHLASADFLAQRDRRLRLATYDSGMARAARSMKLRVFRP